jgi:hypothetical protein
MSSDVGLPDAGPGFLERHRVLGAALGRVVLVLVGVLVGEVLGNVVVQLVELGADALGGGTR